VCQAIARIDLTAGGGPPAGCTTTVDYGLASAIGCFQRIQDSDKVPSGERAILNALVAEWNRNPPLRGLTRSYCANVEKCNGAKADTEALIEATDLYASPSTVRVNGLDITPRRGATVVFDPQLGRIVSKDATVRLGDATLISGGALNLDVSARKGRRVALGSFTGVRGLPSLGRFLPTGAVGVRHGLQDAEPHQPPQRDHPLPRDALDLLGLRRQAAEGEHRRQRGERPRLHARRPQRPRAVAEPRRRAADRRGLRLPALRPQPAV